MHVHLVIDLPFKAFTLLGRPYYYLSCHYAIPLFLYDKIMPVANRHF